MVEQRVVANGGTVHRLIRGLLGQIEAFGVLASVSRAAVPDGFEQTALPRLQLLESLVALPRARGAPALIEASRPFIYNTANWPTGTPIAGWSGDEAGLPAKHHVESVTTFWHLQIRYPDSTIWKILRAALWILHTRDFPSALGYILDLQRAGLILNASHAHGALELLLDARRRVRSDDEIVGFLLVETPDGVEKWLRAEFHQSPPQGDVLRPDIWDDVAYLVQRGEEEVEAVLEAPDYDLWMMGQARLYAMNHAIVLIGKFYEFTKDLRFAARLARLEEILADAGGQFMMLGDSSRELDRFIYSFNSTIVDALRRIFEQFEDWRERLIEERALVPNRLQQILLADTPALENLPQEWKQYSPGFVPIISRLIFSDRYPHLRRSRPLRLPEAIFLLRRVDAGSLHPKLDAATAAALIEMMADETDPTVGEGGEKAGLDLLEGLLGGHTMFGGSVVDRGDLVSICAKLELDSEALEPIVARLYRALYLAEIEDLVEGSFPGPEVSEADANTSLARLNDFYPYFPLGLYESGIRLDLAGNTDGAIDRMYDATMLNPFEPAHWQAVSDALRGRGDDADSLVCAAVAATLSENKPPGTR